MKDKTDIELKSIAQVAISELYERGYDIHLLNTSAKPRKMPVVECRRVVKI